MSIQLQLTHKDHTSLVYLTNGLPVLEGVRIQTDEVLQGVQVEARFQPAYIAPMRWEAGQVGKKGLALPAEVGRPDLARLAELTEAVPGHCHVTLLAEGKEPVEAGFDFTWLPANVWVGGSTHPELLAALVQPNDPVVDALLRAGADLLQKRGVPPRWEGYKCERNAVINRLHALWNAVEGLKLTYSPPPRSWTDFGAGQKVRTPSRIAEGGCATCLDTVTLLAAAMAQAGYNPVILLTASHAMVGAWLKDDVLPEPIVHHPATIRNLVELGELLLLETTAATRVGKGEALPGFQAAQQSAEATLRGQAEGDEFLALDIVRLWATGIRPLAAPTGQGETQAAAPGTAVAATSAKGDDFLPEKSEADLEREISLITPRKRTRIENWQLRLLDLSLRNNLLNSRMDRSQITLLLPGVAALEDALADGKSFSIRNLPETFGTLMANRTDGDLPAEARTSLDTLAADMFAKKQLLALPRKGMETDAQMERRVRALYLEARHDMEESGSSTLNLACGFLKWYRAQDTDALYAPLLLVPVKLTRPSVKAGFSLQAGDEDARINLTLLELLKTEYGISIPQLEGDLPTDESGVDVPLIFRAMRQAIRNCPGWEVVDRCSLGTFSFAKYLMWKDMEDRREALLANPIVHHLAAEEPTRFPAQVDFPDPKGLDTAVDSKEVFTPLSADSSQLAAVLAAARGKNFVLIGPPGTGKSQTITNMIAHCLGHGKTVLFVAEKAAALNVVYKRLQRIGLGDFCLELHSNKANKKAVLAQFKAALDHALAPQGKDTRWARAVGEMERLRTSLNLLPQEMHRPYPDGTSLFNDICRLAADPQAPAFTPCPQDVLTCTAEQKEAMLENARGLAMRYEPVAELVPGPADAIQAREFSFSWEDSLVAALEEYARLGAEWQQRFSTLLAALPIDPALARANMGAMLNLLRAAELTCGHDVRALLPGDAEETLQALRDIHQNADTYRKLKNILSLPYPESTLDTPELPMWLHQWKQAQLCNFISRFFACRRVRKALQLQACSRNKPDCLADLTALLAMRDARDAITRLSGSCPLPACAHGTDTTKEDVAKAEQWAALLQNTAKLRDVAEVWLKDRRSNPVAPGRQAADELQALRATEQQISTAAARLAHLLGSTPPSATGKEGEGVPAWAESLLAMRDHWRELTLWNEQVAASAQAGYTNLVQALPNRTVSPDALADTAETNFSRLRLKAAVGTTPHLNRFTTTEQENHILSFRKKDDAVLTLASEHIVSVLSACAGRTSLDEYRKELAYLQHEISKQRAHKAPRTLLANIPRIAPLLKPCMLMSPLSVAQYLDSHAGLFDVVIFDEASQIPVWDAVGAIARGKSAIIVGDPRQMPPTSFFSRAKVQEDETDEEDTVQDMESILDECRACGIPEMNLTWHYRSKSENLIAFSNRHYYEGKLTTFPAPVTQDTSLQYHHTQGTYLRGASKRINPVEAKALVEHVLQTLRAPGFEYSETTSIGIVTFNTQQQKLIEDLLEDARAKDPSLEPYFAEDNPEAVFVKNLENVQGDERGCIYFSTTYGPDERGVVSMNFGPLNLTGGERRLNVAITRARAAMHVFTSLRPEDIDLNRTKARGAADLRNFLHYAQAGPEGLQRAMGKQPMDNGFTRALAAALEERGWKCHTDVGVSDLRVDLAVEHPQQQGAMLAGIRTDGVGYAAACTARDRDILHESVLTALGWRILHLWALDWWRNPKACTDKLDAALRALL